MGFYPLLFEIFKEECRNLCIVGPLIFQHIFFSAIKCSDVVAELNNEFAFRIGGVYRFCLAFNEEIFALHDPLLLALTICPSRFIRGSRSGVIPSFFYILRVDAEPLAELGVITDDFFKFFNRRPGVFRVDIIDSQG